jgi:hypothetical protein
MKFIFSSSIFPPDRLAFFRVLRVIRGRSTVLFPHRDMASRYGWAPRLSLAAGFHHQYVPAGRSRRRQGWIDDYFSQRRNRELDIPRPLGGFRRSAT